MFGFRAANSGWCFAKKYCWFKFSKGLWPETFILGSTSLLVFCRYRLCVWKITLYRSWRVSRRFGFDQSVVNVIISIIWFTLSSFLFSLPCHVISLPIFLRPKITSLFIIYKASAGRKYEQMTIIIGTIIKGLYIDFWWIIIFFQRPRCVNSGINIFLFVFHKTWTIRYCVNESIKTFSNHVHWHNHSWNCKCLLVPYVWNSSSRS